jgi:hypothetical protein
LFEIKKVMAQILEGARGRTTHDDVYNLEPTHRPDQPRVRRIKKPHGIHPLFNQVVRSERMVCREPTLQPRTVSVPIRMPYPPALNQGCIYENQTVVRKRFFDRKAA